MSSKEECKCALKYLQNSADIETKWYSVDIIKKLIDEHFELKEKYNKILDDVHNYRYETHCMKMTIRNLCEHFGVESEKELQNIYLNKPYKLEELKPDMWVWDKKLEVCIEILGVTKDKEILYKLPSYITSGEEFLWIEDIYFEENRFYPVQVANEVIGDVK